MNKQGQANYLLYKRLLKDKDKYDKAKGDLGDEHVQWQKQREGNLEDQLPLHERNLQNWCRKLGGFNRKIIPMSHQTCDVTGLGHLGPIKREVVNFEPPIEIFHKVISEKSMGSVIRLANDEDVWHISNETSFKILSEINEYFAGRFQFDNLETYRFGIGQTDADDEISMEHQFGIEIFLNDVEIGGDVIFSSVGTSVLPSPGTALVWTKTKKLFCPVVLGELWGNFTGFIASIILFFCCFIQI